MGDVIYLNVTTTEEIPVSRVLEGAPHDLKYVLVLGRKDDGSLYVAASSGSAGKAALALMQAERLLLDSIEEGEG